MIFDTHCHLNDPELYKDIENIYLTAKKLNVHKFLVVGYDTKSSKLAISITKLYPGIYSAVGVHPTETKNLSIKQLHDVLELSKNRNVVAIGEIGLDYYWEKDHVQREIQKEFFIEQILYANANNLPISVHSRDAIFDTMEILKKYPPKHGGIMHCFSGSVEIMRECISLGMLIGLGGTVTFKNAKTPKEVAFEVPLDKLVVETDSPYLTPHPLRGMTNKPEYIRYVVDEIAAIKGISPKHVAETTTANACKLFGIENE